MLRRSAPQLARCLRALPSSQLSAGASSSWVPSSEPQEPSSHNQIPWHRHMSTGPNLQDIESASEVAQHASAIVEASNAAEASGLLAAAADVWAPTRALLEAMAGMHSAFDVPWWGAIALTGLAVRLASLPLVILQQRKSGVMQDIKNYSTKLQELQAATNAAKTSGEYERCSRLFNECMAEFKSKHGKEMKFVYMMPLLSVVNAAVFISQFNAIRELAKEVPSMAHGGALWFQDLTIPDPFFGLPVLCALMTLGLSEFGVLSSEMAMAPQQAAMMKWVFRGVSLIFIPAGQYVSSAIAVLWCSNSVLAISQSLFLRNKRVRKALALPDAAQVAAQAAQARGGLGEAMQKLFSKAQEAAAQTSTQPAAGAAAGAAAAGGIGAGPGASAAAGLAARAKPARAAPPPGMPARGPPAPGIRISGLSTNKPKKKRTV